MVSRIEAATSPVDGVWLVNGTALPGSTVSAVLDDASAVPIAVAAVPRATAVALRTAATILSLDMGSPLKLVTKNLARIGPS
jgi:hypothetical protein